MNLNQLERPPRNLVARQPVGKYLPLILRSEGKPLATQLIFKIRMGLKARRRRLAKAKAFVRWCKDNGHTALTVGDRQRLSDSNARSLAWIAREVPEHHVTDKRAYYREVYLSSDHWKALRSRKLSANPVCECCGTSKRLDIHHLNYRNLYDVTLDDLQTLCRRCHHLEHDKAD